MFEINSEQKKYILLQTVSGFVINILINGGIGYYCFKMNEILSIKSFAIDFSMTNFMLLFMTSMIVSRVTHKEINDSKVAPIYSAELEALAHKFSPRPVLNGFAIALSCSFILVPIFLSIIYFRFNGSLEGQSFILFKALYSGILAFIYTPIVILIAMAEYHLLKTN